MVRKSPRKKPTKRLAAAAATVRVKKEPPASPSPKKTEVEEHFDLPLKIKLNLQELSSKAASTSRRSEQRRQPVKPDPDIPHYVPPHMLGRDLKDPLADQIEGSNRGLQKPRFGVKVPNRNLTSPILSHTELNRELLARSRLRRPVVYEEVDNNCTATGSYIFSLKMVSRLAGSMPNRSFPLKLNPQTLKMTLNTNTQLMPKMDARLERELALKQLNEMRTH